MIDISIEDGTYERMKRHAQPFETQDRVINRAFDALDQLAKPRVADPMENVHTIDPRALPNLTHTKVLSATIEGEIIVKPNWNSLLDEMLRRALKRVGTFDLLRQVCPVNMVQGRKEDEGYSYLSDIDISVQGQDANNACRALVNAAQGIGIELNILFYWRFKKGAAYAGERAMISLNGSFKSDRKAA